LNREEIIIRREEENMIITIIIIRITTTEINSRSLINLIITKTPTTKTIREVEILTIITTEEEY